MSNVYAKSHITIAATSSPNASTGFIHVGAHVDQQHRILTTLPDGTNQYLYVRSTTEHWKTRMHLHQRAWAYQERLLPVRVLHFTSHDMIFECNYRTIHEGGHGTNTGIWPDNDLKHFIRMRGDANFAKIYDGWMSIVQTYPAKQLTFPTDRFPALSGVAQIFKWNLNDTYIAGLWRNDLTMGLLWSRKWPYKNIFSRTHDKEVFIAPSWSWASATYEFIVPSSDFRPYAQLELVDHHVELANGNNQFGQLLSASIVVRGPSKAFLAKDLGIFEGQKYYNFAWHDPTGSLSLRLRLDGPRLHATGDENVLLLACTKQEALEKDVLLPWKRQHLHFNAYGLILERVKDTDDTFTRIGVFKVDTVRDEERSWVAQGFVETTITMI